MRTIRSLAVLLTLATACGDDAGTSPVDAEVTEDADVEIDAPPTTTGCDYTETNDEGNDDVTQNGSPELTGLSLSAAAGRVLCGSVSPDHFDDTDDTVDVDAYALQIPAGPIIVTLSGAGLETLGEAKLGVYSGANFETIEAEEPLVGSHAVVMLDLPAGAYEFSLLSSNGTAITSAIDYKIKVSVDTPATRCPKIAGAANYMETTANNDVIQISYSGGTSITETPSAADAPQASGVNLLPGFAARISGEIAATGQAGEYNDPDTYSFTTGPGVDSITIRLNWPGAADLDWYLFKGALPYVARRFGSNTVEDEMLTVSVLPNSTYWIWTGMDEDSTAPKTYDLSICGTTFLAP
jgi:hypothetical protein